MKSDPGRFSKTFSKDFPFFPCFVRGLCYSSITKQKGKSNGLYGNPEIKKAYQAGFNDGLQCGVDNAREFEYITEEQAEDLLTELVKEEN